MGDLTKGQGHLRRSKHEDHGSETSSETSRGSSTLFAELSKGPGHLKRHDPTKTTQKPKPEKPISELEKKMIAQREMIRQHSQGSNVSSDDEGWSD